MKCVILILNFKILKLVQNVERDKSCGILFKKVFICDFNSM